MGQKEETQKETANTGNLNSGYWNSGDRNSGNRNSGYWNSGNRNSGYWNSGDWNSGNRNSGYLNSGDRNSGNLNSGYWNSGYLNSGDRNSGNLNSGNLNSGDRNSGYLNSNNPTLRFFNKETNLVDTTSVIFPDYFYFDLIEWVEVSAMTDEEKKQYPHYAVTTGFLRVFDYKEAWKSSFMKASKEDVKKTLKLPNFDAKIFEEISGISAKMIGDKLGIEIPDCCPYCQKCPLNDKTKEKTTQ
jgi:hypothetical protein